MSLFKNLLLACLPNRRKNPIHESVLHEVKSILFRPLGRAFGDACVHTAHLQQIRQIYPKAKIAVWVGPSNRAIFEACGVVDELIEIKIGNCFKQRKKWDLLLDFENNFNTSSLIMDLISAPKYLMIFRKYEKKHYHFNNVKHFDFNANLGEKVLFSKYVNQSILAKMATLNPAHSVVHTSPSNDEKMQKYWQSCVANNIVAKSINILLCLQGSSREVPAVEIAEILNKSITQPQFFQIVVSFTSAAERYQQELQALCPDLTIHLSPKTSAAEYFSLMKKADLVFAVNGGSLHLACAFDKPLLSFHANSEPTLSAWKPLLPANIPQCYLVARNPLRIHTGVDETYNFDTAKAIAWLKQFIQAQNLA
ncbi:glycosyltransferase family 9 protein [Lonepinella koalarum]|uniref:ADP-heptose:LPS heptosyltransferase n=1 Tax=Lonepinella koalarum TaxID=53417 RepID=A0A4R1L284_9PAST|nr:glycosyltransferase family 9 protein [Lonepinella koalarum]MDH2925851.1 hypothetical protein [Lonepinella koalarum]TCK71003.1 ADP-heptose:LPS heptosyltransferase [Lonepinella koalarum]TFJ90738.1 lipopolysaccharide heptosyltransferase family protein [Lonepinella koalarum]TYG34521.1 glycosyltransferase family 9 protein [Lonepinella koalarum]